MPQKSQKGRERKTSRDLPLVNRTIIYIRHLFYFSQPPQEKLLGPLGSKRSGKIVFLFDDEFNPAPSFDNMKIYYLLNEMKRRGWQSPGYGWTAAIVKLPMVTRNLTT
jgi:hypothetical protein